MFLSHISITNMNRIAIARMIDKSFLKVHTYNLNQCFIIVYFSNKPLIFKI